jgi:hypothetical protein
MPNSRSNHSSKRERVKVLLTTAGYAVQLYGATVIRSVSLPEARRLARDLRRALGERAA